MENGWLVNVTWDSPQEKPPLPLREAFFFDEVRPEAAVCETAVCKCDA